MKYAVFEYTRNLRNDYSWRVKPKMLSGDFSKVVQQFIYLRDQLREDKNLEWNKICFFMKYENVNIACQILENGEDYVGRNIYTMRGIATAGNDWRALLGIPDVVKQFMQNGCPAVEEECMNESYDGEYEFHLEDEINPLLNYDETQFVEEVNNPSFMRLMSHIREKKCSYGMIVGPGAEYVFMHISHLQIHNEKVFHSYYDFTQSCEKPIYRFLKVPVISLPHHSEIPALLSANKALLYLKVYREGKRNGNYEWILKRKSDDLTIKSSKHHFEDKLEMKTLVKEEQKILRYYSLIGFAVE